MRVLVTIDLPQNLALELSKYAQIIRPEDLARSPELIEDIDAILCGNVSGEVISKAKRLKFIQTITAGVDHLPWDQIGPQVIVCSNSGSNAWPVAEHAVGLLLTAIKKISEYDRRMKSGIYGKLEESSEVRDKRVTILGLGPIGTAIGIIMKSMGAYVVGYNRSGRAKGEGIDKVYGEGRLEEALSGSDYVFIALPLNKYTRGLINYDRLRLMNKRGVLVNVARAEIVVKEDLKRFLLENPQFIYASDVWWNPGDLSRDADIIGLPNVIATPWVAGGGGNRSILIRMINHAVENLITYLKGGEPINVVKHDDYK